MLVFRQQTMLWIWDERPIATYLFIGKILLEPYTELLINGRDFFVPDLEFIWVIFWRNFSYGSVDIKALIANWQAVTCQENWITRAKWSDVVWKIYLGNREFFIIVTCVTWIATMVAWGETFCIYSRPIMSSVVSSTNRIKKIMPEMVCPNQRLN